MWGGGENSNISFLHSIYCTLPKMSNGTDVLNITIGTQNSSIKYEGKLLLNSSSSGHNIVGNVNGTLTTLEANVDSIETSFIGTNIKLYGYSNAIETFSYSYGPDKFISNYDDFNSISDYNENRFDPYNECFYQYTRSFNFDTYDNLLNNSANYYYTMHNTILLILQNNMVQRSSNGIVVIKFNYPQEELEGIYSTVSSVSPVADSKVSVNYVGHSPSFTSKVLLVKEYLGNIDYYNKPLSAANGTIDFDSSSFSTAEIAQSTFHAVLDDFFLILYGNIVGQPSNPLH